jgi:hypothetical protein
MSRPVLRRRTTSARAQALAEVVLEMIDLQNAGATSEGEIAADSSLLR